jgi:uncharacterized protein YecE (DUF72 family)
VSSPGTFGPTRVGVAGWSYPDWEGIVYPRLPRFDGLAYLAGLVETIEVNSSFYRIPTRGAAESWARRTRTNPRFRFTVKLYRGFTHEREARASDEHAFKESLTPLMEAGSLGAVLMQFPWSFKNEPQSLVYLAELVDRFEGYPLVLEVRHASWNEPELYRFLEERGVGFCNIDQPLIGRSLAPSERATGPVGYVRLHGRNYQDWFREGAGRDARYDYLYSAEELDPWIEKISEVSSTAAETYVITNNHFRGQAVVNALQIRSRVERRKVRAPASLLECYPVLGGVAEPDSPSQRELFS